MAFNIDTLEIGIVTQAAEAVQTIRTLANSLQKLADIQLDSTKIQTFVRELSALASQSVGLQMLTGELTALSKALNKFKVPKAAANDLRTNIANSKDPEDSLWGIKSAGATSLEKNFDKLIPQLERLNEVGKDISGLTAISTALVNISAAGSQLGVVASNVQALSSAISGTTKVTSQLQKDAGKLDNTLRKVKQTVDDSNKAAKSASKGFSGFGSTVARVAKMMLIRMAIRALIKGIREGIQMFVEWDRTSYNSMAGAANAMDALKASVNNLKGSFGAFAGSLLTIVQPALTFLIDRLADVFNLLQHGLAILKGEDKWFKYVGGSANEAAGGVKALKNALFGFDELNVLPSANGGGSGANWLTGDYVPTDVNPDEMQQGGINFMDTVTNFLPFNNGELSSILDLINLLIGGDENSTIWDTIFKDWDWWQEKFKPWMQNTEEWLEEKAKKIELFFTEDIPTFFKETLPNSIKKFGSWFDKQWGQAKKDWETDMQMLKDLALSLWNLLPESWRKPLESAYNTFNTRFVTPTKIVIEALKSSFGLFVDYVTHPSKWTKEGWTEFTGKLTTIWNTAMFDIQRNWQATEDSVNTGLEGLGKDAKTGLDVLREEMDQNPLMVRFNARIDAKNFTLTTNNLLNDVQTALYKNPLEMPTVVSTGNNQRNRSGKQWLNPREIGQDDIWGFASGGVPNVGTLFYAGEAGAEVVANMGHSTGVMNVSQMQEAVANGNIEVVNAVYAMANMIAGAVQNKNFDVYMDSSKVGQSVTKWQYNQQRRGVPQGAY